MTAQNLLPVQSRVFMVCVDLLRGNSDSVVVVLEEEFAVQPSDVEVAEGEVAVLNCGPPVGHPEPNVIWKRDGRPIENTDHHYTVSTVSTLHSITFITVKHLCMTVRIVLRVGRMTEKYVTFMEDFNLTNSKQVTSPTWHKYELNNGKAAAGGGNTHVHGQVAATLIDKEPLS